MNDFSNIFQKITELLDYSNVWFNQYILSGLGGFIKALFELFIKILQFTIDILQWVMAHLH